MGKFFTMLCSSHEDIDLYVTLGVDLNEDMSLDVIMDVSHPYKKDMNHIARLKIDKTNTSLLALMNHITVPELPEFFYENYKIDEAFIEPGEVADQWEKVINYLRENNIPYQFVKEEK